MKNDLEHRLADLVAAVSGGEISPEDALSGDHSLTALGLLLSIRMRQFH